MLCGVPKRCPCKSVPFYSCWPPLSRYRSGVPDPIPASGGHPRDEWEWPPIISGLQVIAHRQARKYREGVGAWGRHAPQCLENTTAVGKSLTSLGIG